MDRADVERRRIRDKGLIAAALVWGVVVAAGMIVLWNHSLEAGVAGRPPGTWPVASRLSRRPGVPTLVVLAHPQCPCSRATIGELARLMVGAQDKVDVHVVFAKPAGVDEGWAHTDLWDSAGAIPGVLVSSDDDEREAHLFGGATSGQTMLYDGEGQLRFSGGITSARGHAGDNDGSSALTEILVGGTSALDTTPVFGCPLEEAPRGVLQREGPACSET